MSSSVTFSVKSLGDQCIQRIVMHLEEFPSNHLSLLPLSLRKEILWSVPIADVCKLEGTGFVNSIDRKDFWSDTFYEMDSFASPETYKNIQKYIKEKWNSADLAREVVYGQIFGVGLGFYSIDHTGFYIDYESDVNSMMSLMYGVRRRRKWCYGMVSQFCHEIPPRYQHCVSSCDSLEKFVDATINCFCGDLPTYFFVEEIDEITCGDLVKYIPFLRNLRVFGVLSEAFGPTFQERIVAVVEAAVNLEAFIVVCIPRDDLAPLSLDWLFLELTKCPSFLSSMHLFNVHGICDPDIECYTVSYETLKTLVEAFLSSSTDHAQAIHLSEVTITCTSLQDPSTLVPHVECSAKKTIELNDCKFIVKVIDCIFNR